jgi:hypothetical protein
VTRRTLASRILVIANETVSGGILLDTVRDRVAPGGRVLVVAPALNSRLRHWLSDEDAARSAAAARLRQCLERLRLAGVDARGIVGDPDPLLAIEDALQFFAADEILVATHPEQRSHWLARGVVERIPARFALPVVHIVVDRELDVEYVRTPAGQSVRRLAPAA